MFSIDHPSLESYFELIEMSEKIHVDFTKHFEQTKLALLLLFDGKDQYRSIFETIRIVEPKHPLAHFSIEIAGDFKMFGNQYVEILQDEVRIELEDTWKESNDLYVFDLNQNFFIKKCGLQNQALDESDVRNVKTAMLLVKSLQNAAYKALMNHDFMI